MEDNNTNPKSESLKVLRVSPNFHQLAKINAAKRGLKIQTYIEALLKADEENKVTW